MKKQKGTIGACKNILNFGPWPAEDQGRGAF